MPADPAKIPTVWMRSIRWHTYEGKPQPEGAFYLAHADMVETIEKVLRFAVQDTAPPKAVRPPSVPLVPPDASAPSRRGRAMTTQDWPEPKP